MNVRSIRDELARKYERIERENVKYEYNLLCAFKTCGIF